MTATFADGSTASADVLIGADGVHSTVRRLIDPDAPDATYTGLLALEGIADATVAEAPDTMVLAFGRQAYHLYWAQDGGGTVWGVNRPSPEPLS